MFFLSMLIILGYRSPATDIVIYWSKRESKLYDGLTSKCLKKQDHTCGECRLMFLPGERIHLHHIEGF